MGNYKLVILYFKMLKVIEREIKRNY